MGDFNGCEIAHQYSGLVVSSERRGYALHVGQDGLYVGRVDIHEPASVDAALDYLRAFDNAHQRDRLLIFAHMNFGFDTEFPSCL
jgi:hypothetical protein